MYISNKILFWAGLIIFLLLFFKFTKQHGNKKSNYYSELENPLLLNHDNNNKQINFNDHTPEMPQININSIRDQLPQRNQQDFMYPVLDGVNDEYKKAILQMRGL